MDMQISTPKVEEQRAERPGPPAANRHRLPDERPAITHHFAVGGHEGYLTVGLYPNGQPGEIFIRMAKEGSTIAGLMECFGTVVSVSLQHGVPLRVLCDKLSHTRSEPSGWTGSAELGSRSPSWTTCSGGSNSASSPERNWPYSPHPAITAALRLIPGRLYRFRPRDLKLATRRPAVPAAL